MATRKVRLRPIARSRRSIRKTTMPSAPCANSAAKSKARRSSYFPPPTNATRSMLVAPGVPSGTPAVITIRSPCLAKPSLKANLAARSTMSSRSCASSVSTQCSPQASASLRTVLAVGRKHDDRRFRPLARRAQSGRTRFRPRYNRTRVDGVGDFVHGGHDRIGCRFFRRAALPSRIC